MPKFNKHVIITGSARSGTSWVSELFARPFRYRLLFEPEHDTQTENGHLICDRLIEKNLDNKKAIIYFKKIFSNNVDSNWIAQHSNRKWKMHLWPFLAKKYVIKFVRCNLSAKFMNEEFGIPVIHIIRNPYDVLLSQERVKFPWLYDLKYFKSQPNLVELIQTEYKVNLNETSKLSDIEILTLRWCIENEIPIKFQQPFANNFYIIKYEELRNKPELFLELCNKLNFKPIENLEDKFKLPSSKTHPKSAIRNNSNDVKQFSKQQLKQINNILDQFNSTFYTRKD